MTDFTNKVAFITGGAGGLGLAMARSFAKRGASIMIADIDAEALSAAEVGLRDEGASVASIVCDVADATAVQAAADATMQAFGKVNIVVNNAGVAVSGPPGEIPLQDWRWIVDINLMGVVHGVEIFTPLMKAAGEPGHFVNVASMAGQVGGPFMGPYTATKFAVVGYSESLRHDLAPHQIGVSMLCPGWVATKIHESGDRKPSGAAEQAADPMFSQVKAAVESGLSADDVADYVAECVEGNRLYIFTHPEMWDAIAARGAELKQDYQPCMTDPRFST